MPQSYPFRALRAAVARTWTVAVVLVGGVTAAPAVAEPRREPRVVFGYVAPPEAQPVRHLKRPGQVQQAVHGEPAPQQAPAPVRPALKDRVASERGQHEVEPIQPAEVGEPLAPGRSVPPNQLVIDIRPPAGELPPNAAAAHLTHATEDTILGCWDRGWAGTACLWQAPAVCHRPLYFEQPNVERYGYTIPFAQPFICGAHFFGSVVAFPYLVGAQRPNECIYNLGYYRPGSPTPFRWPMVPISARGAALQGVVVTGAVFAIP